MIDDGLTIQMFAYEDTDINHMSIEDSYSAHTCRAYVLQPSSKVYWS